VFAHTARVHAFVWRLTSQLEIADMAMLSDAVHDIAAANALLGGSYEHQQHRRHLVTPFLRFARTMGALSPSMVDIGEWVIHAYAQRCMSQGMSAGNLANVFSALRVVFRALGRNIDRTCSNQRLGLPRRSRKGSRRTWDLEETAALAARARKMDKGFALLILLARYLGLRRKEALMCGRDLQMWRDAVAAGATTIEVMRGAKNARPRTVELLPGKREATLQVIDAALEYCRDRNFQLISGRRKTLACALNRFKSLARRLMMRGAASFHSLRYSYAVDSATAMLDAGVDPHTALVRLSASLGHGPSRTQMILQYYCGSIRHRFDGYLKLAKGQKHRPRASDALPRADARHRAKLRHAALSGHPMGNMAPPAAATGRGRRSKRRRAKVNPFN
jgi:Integrase/Phage integrase, N-terminal